MMMGFFLLPRSLRLSNYGQYGSENFDTSEEKKILPLGGEDICSPCSARLTIFNDIQDGITKKELLYNKLLDEDTRLDSGLSLPKGLDRSNFLTDTFLTDSIQISAEGIFVALFLRSRCSIMMFLSPR